MHFSCKSDICINKNRKEKKERIFFKWNLLLSDEDMHLGVGGREFSLVLKSQINEHDKLLLLALALPQVAKWHCPDSLLLSPLTPILPLSIDLGQPL